MSTTSQALTLDEALVRFRSRRFVAMPIAGTIAWIGIAIAGVTLPPIGQVWAVYIGAGSIFYVGLGVAKLTGEDLLNRTEKNPFDQLFMLTVLQAVAVFSIAIPFASVDHTSIPMSVGILTGLMWAPTSWLIGHWVGLFHTITRTAGILAVWVLLPEARFVAVPLVVVAVYLVTIGVLEQRWRSLQASAASA